jgi:hypothetical protein
VPRLLLWPVRSPVMRLAFVANDGGARIERVQPAEAAPAQHEADRRDRPANTPRDHRAAQAPAAKGEDLIRRALIEPGWAAVRS